LRKKRKENLKVKVKQGVVEIGAILHTNAVRFYTQTQCDFTHKRNAILHTNPVRFYTQTQCDFTHKRSAILHTNALRFGSESCTAICDL
jgi:hypothetical protein